MFDESEPAGLPMGNFEKNINLGDCDRDLIIAQHRGDLVFIIISQGCPITRSGLLRLSIRNYLPKKF